MRRTRKHLEEMAQAARALALYAEELHALLSERPLEAEGVAREVEEAFARARLVVLSGGLGPTPDDVTREAVALALVPALLSAGLFYLLDRGRGRFG